MNGGMLIGISALHAQRLKEDERQITFRRVTTLKSAKTFGHVELGTQDPKLTHSCTWCAHSDGIL
jgi:hypothetical protein